MAYLGGVQAAILYVYMNYMTDTWDSDMRNTENIELSLCEILPVNLVNRL